MFKGLASGDGDGFIQPALSVDNVTPREGWSTSSAVSFVARTFETVRFGHDDAPACPLLPNY
jgi:presequence protease